MRTFSWPRLLFAGLMATSVMTLYLYFAPIFGLPELDFARMVGLELVEAPAERVVTDGAWWLGFGVHLVLGIVVFPFFYGAFLHPLLRGSRVLRGVIFGLLLWFLFQSFFLPMMGWGIWGSQLARPAVFAFGTCAAHLIYGLVLGAAAGVQAAPYEGPQQSETQPLDTDEDRPTAPRTPHQPAV